MNSKINKILKEIELKKIELKKTYQEMMKKYNFKIENKKIIFPNIIRKKNKLFKKPLFKGFSFRNFLYILSMPIIYGMLIPLGILDISLIFYQNICFRIYKIPLVIRKNYIVFDRQYLDYLNFLQKFNCMYCSYGNGIIAFGREIAGRTEKFRCPIKHAKKIEGNHPWQNKFADYGDPEGFQKEFTNPCFFKKK